MKRMTDGHKTAEITMEYFDEAQQRWIDIAEDFFADGQLHETVDGTDTIIVDDVDYCIDQARDWENGRGDYCYDDITTEDGDSARSVYVDEIELDPELLPTRKEIVDRKAKLAIAKVMREHHLTDEEKAAYKARKAANVVKIKTDMHFNLIRYVRDLYEDTINGHWMWTAEKLAKMISTNVLKNNDIAGMLYVDASYDEVMRITTGHLTDLDLDAIIDTELRDVLDDAGIREKLIKDYRYTPEQADQIIAYAPEYDRKVAAHEYPFNR